jgi:nucleotide-binding universal stress UspA family protein
MSSPVEIRRIVVGVDTAANSVAALRRAAAEAAAHSAAVTVVHVIDDDEALRAPSEAARVVEEMLDRHTPGEFRASALIRIERGEPTRVLADLSVEAELLVIGACANSERRGIYGGSVIRYLLAHSACPLRVCANHNESLASQA